MDLDFYVLRHAIAVERGTEGYENDFDRPLTAEGADKLRRIAKAIRKLDLSLERIFSSPFVRARQTAEVVASTIAPRIPLDCRDSLGAEEDPREFLTEFQKLQPAPVSIMVVGHEPYLSSMISLLISGSTQPCVRLKKAGLCKLRVTTLQVGRCAELEWLLTPKQLLQID